MSRRRWPGLLVCVWVALWNPFGPPRAIYGQAATCPTPVTDGSKGWAKAANWPSATDAVYYSLAGLTVQGDSAATSDAIAAANKAIAAMNKYNKENGINVRYEPAPSGVVPNFDFFIPTNAPVKDADNNIAPSSVGYDWDPQGNVTIATIYLT